MKIRKRYLVTVCSWVRFCFPQSLYLLTIDQSSSWKMVHKKNHKTVLKHSRQERSIKKAILFCRLLKIEKSGFSPRQPRFFSYLFKKHKIFFFTHTIFRMKQNRITIPACIHPVTRRCLRNVVKYVEMRNRNRVAFSTNQLSDHFNQRNRYTLK